MPKLTFFNLPIEKQQSLLNSLKKEFSRVSLFEASIANIVKDANIPRGSFYQYFEDKEDAYYYLLEQMTKTNHDKFIDILEQSDGDIFETFEQSFNIVLEQFNEKENRNFFKNVLLNMNYKTENILSEMFSETNDDKFSEYINLINKQYLKVKNEREVIQIVMIIVLVTVDHLMRYFADEVEDEDAIENYHSALSLIKRGIYNL